MVCCNRKAHALLVFVTGPFTKHCWCPQHSCDCSLSGSGLFFTKLKICPKGKRNLTGRNAKHCSKLVNQPTVKHMAALSRVWESGVPEKLRSDLEEFPFQEVLPCVAISVNRERNSRSTLRSCKLAFHVRIKAVTVAVLRRQLRVPADC